MFPHRSLTPLLALLAALALVLAACPEDEPAVEEPDEEVEEPEEEEVDEPEEDVEEVAVDIEGDPDATIVEVLEASGDFTTLVELLEESGLDQELAGDGPLTLFAPPDEAFDVLPEAALEALRDDPEELEERLGAHVVAQELPTAEIDSGDEVETLAGTLLVFQEGEDGELLAGIGELVETDVEASNGLIHVTDLVLNVGPPAEDPEEAEDEEDENDEEEDDDE